MKKFSFKLAINLAIFIFIQNGAGSLAYANSLQMVAPPYNATNRHSVNMVTGQIQMTHSDVSIGGTLGLSHSISLYSGSWIGPDSLPIGPVDGFEGRLFIVDRREYPLDQRQWIVAFDGSSTQFFNPGETRHVFTPDSSGYFSEASQKGYKLRQVSGVGMVMTKPDGTQVIFSGAEQLDTYLSYNMSEIRSPNGLITKIKMFTDREPASVTTNTGFQLRYYYVPNYAPLDPKLAALNIQPNMDSHGWWEYNPRYVVGINNAVQYCPSTGGAQLNEAACDTTNWPKAEYIWPDGMPRRIFVAPGTFSVVNPDGSRADYIHTPRPRCVGTYCDSVNTIVRLSSVKPATSNQATVSYGYIDTSTYVPWGISGFFTPKEYGVLERSSAGNTTDDVITYDLSTVRNIGDTPAYKLHRSWGVKTIAEVGINIGAGLNGGKPLNITAWNYRASFSTSGILQEYTDDFAQTVSTMTYDTRENVTSITSQGGTQYAEYEASCTTANEKYCNKPKWVQDAKGNKTYMTYHPESGQIATVTSPANKKGISAVTRYQYEQKSAYYYTAPGVKTYGSPIWMLVREKSCINTATQDDACVGGSTDEVIKTYEYNNDNLLLSGIAVTAADTTNTIKTLRTCYQYDVYGNQIGVTEPRANLTSCEARY